MHVEKHLYSVSIIVPVLNVSEIIENCIESLLKQDFPQEQYEIIVVDNGSEDNTCQLVGQYPVRLICCTKIGPSAARNKGIYEARNDLLLFVDADCIAHRKLIMEHVFVHMRADNKNGKSKIVGGGIEGGNFNIWGLCDDFCSWSFFNKNLPPRKIRNMCPTANMSILRETVIRLGGFNENLLFGEDYAFCTLAIRKGYEILFHPQATVTHINRTSFKGFMDHSVKWAEADTDLYNLGVFKIRGNLFSFFLYYICFIPVFLLQPLVFGLWARRLVVLLIYPFIIYNRIKIAILRVTIHYRIRKQYLLPS